MMISGSNLGFNCLDNSYYFSKYGQIWGWATWKRAWRKYEKNVNPLNSNIKYMNNMEKIYWQNNFERIKWDVQFAVYSIWLNNGIAILPSVNLVTNIGFDLQATNYKLKDNPNANIESKILTFPMIHPNLIRTDDDLDSRIFFNSYYKSFLQRFWDLIKLKCIYYFNRFI